MTIEELAEKIRELQGEDAYKSEWIEDAVLLPILKEFAEGVKSRALLEAAKFLEITCDCEPYGPCRSCDGIVERLRVLAQPLSKEETK